MSNTHNSNTGDDGRKQILVIGGTGAVGAPIVRRLDQAGWNVRVTSRNASQARAKFGPRVEKAIEVMLEKIKKNPPAFPPTPAYLKR